MGLLLLAVPASAQAGAIPHRPNIVLILADDLGYGDVACYNDESKIPTPHLDHLATEGARFTDAHTPSSVCSPTRYGILTGRYCWRTPLKRSVLWPWDPPLIEKDRLTLPGMLRRHGYHTACIGKWHLGWRWLDKEGKPVSDRLPPLGQYAIRQRIPIGKIVDLSGRIGEGPVTRGFDYYFGDDVPNFPPYVFIENDRLLGNPSVWKPPEMFGGPGPMLPGWDLSVVLPTLTQRAVQYIEQRKEAREKPFFLYLALTAPHTPIAPTPRFIGKSKAGWYGDYVNEVDWVVGQVVAALERNHLVENTLLIFTSDNGSPERDGTNMGGKLGSVKRFGHEPNHPWRGRKAQIWEGGHRVPLIVRWPGFVPPGEVSREQVVMVDFMRTIAAIVGDKLPEDAAEDSFNILPALRDPSHEHGIRNHMIHHSISGQFAIRAGEWKFILDSKPGVASGTGATPPGQLYNLTSDPGETKDVRKEHPEIVSRLAALLDKYRKQGRSSAITH